MASKSGHTEPSHEDVEDLLEGVDKTLDRVKVLYEQYFLGIQKQPPQHLHTDVERKLRDLTQIQIRNTALRYRFAMLQQKFGSYNSYWRRTLRQIENGTYLRNLSKISRDAVRNGAAIPEEILAAMPQRMREQVRRDREAALALAARRAAGARAPDETIRDADELSLDDADLVDALDAPTELRRPVDQKTTTGAHVLAESDGDFDLDAFFKQVQAGTIPPPMGPIAARPAPPPRPPKRPTAPPPPPPLPPRRPAAPSQITRPVPFAPGASAKVEPVAVETMSGPFPRTTATPASGVPQVSMPIPVIVQDQTSAIPTLRSSPPAPSVPRRAAPEPADPALRAPPGMTDADVNVLYAKYVKAKQAVGEQTGPGAYSKLLKTINAQAPKIMEQYKARGVEFTVVVKDNQVVIRAKPKM